MKIALVEPFYTGSHKAWADGYAAGSRHDITLFTMPGQHWKWRMHGGGITLARKLLHSGLAPDLILATDMMDLTIFISMIRHHIRSVPVVFYFHENQICYPWSPADRDVQQDRDQHYGFINFASAMAADVVLFNSLFHHRTFFDALPAFLGQFPGFRSHEHIAVLQKKSDVLPLGLDLSRLGRLKPARMRSNRKPLVLWNHRWEYDKNPDDFFKALLMLADEGADFEVAVLGANFKQHPRIFDEAGKRLGRRVIQFGFVDSPAEYARWLWRSDVIPVTARQDFFGISVAEAVYCGCYPVLPARLAYPDLFPLPECRRLYYRTMPQLVKRIREAMKHSVMPEKEDWARYIRPFDWSVMTDRYDDMLEKIIDKWKRYD